MSRCSGSDGSAASSAMVRPFLQGSPAAWLKSQSVSYTHLDVYKRQGLNIGTLLGPPVTGFFIENFGWGVATIPLAVASVLGAIAFFFVKTHDHDSDKATARAAEIDSDLTQAAV